jgi:ferredoxin
MGAHVDWDLCFGCGACQEVCPGAFEVRDEKAWVLSDEAVDTCADALTVCPVRAIQKDG